MSVTWLASVLRTAGLEVVPIAGWKDRGRPGAFDPKGILVHHTGAVATPARPMPSLATLVHGRPDLNGPLCQLGLGFDGIYRAVAAGRANHAGTAKASGPMPAGDGNALYIGIEVDYSGSQDMSDKQMAALVKGCAAILKELRRNESFVRGHKETSTSGKWDPGRHGPTSPEYLMGSIRNQIGHTLRPRVQFALFDGEGHELDHSAVVEDRQGPRRDRLRKFLDGSVAQIDVELEQDRDVVIRRRKV